MDSESGGAALTGAGSGAAAGAAFGPWGAAIGAAVGLVGGLLSADAQKKARRRQMAFEGQMKGLETQQQAAQSLVSGQQNAFHTMMQGYGRIAGGG